MKIRSAVPYNGCLVFLTDRKTKKNKKETEKKQKKTSVKHIRIRLIGGCVETLNDFKFKSYARVVNLQLDLFNKHA